MTTIEIDIDIEKLEMFLWKRGINFTHYERSRNKLIVYGRDFNVIAEYDYKSLKDMINAR